MRKLTLIFFLFCVAITSIARNKAVLIGVSNYPEGSGWCKLNAHNDLTLLRSVLSSEWEITFLEDRQATCDGIVSLLDKTAKSTSLGDTVLIHFSGHGQQMLPIEADHIHDPDMLDEAIIPYDAKKDWSLDYTGQNHLRDNDFGALIDAIRNKAGVEGLVVVVLDACHSDSMPRIPGAPAGTTEGYRGTSDIFGKEVSDESIKNRFKRDTSKIEIVNNAAVVYLSACQANSRNAEITSSEGIGYGSLSYAVAEALKHGGLDDMEAFLDRVITAMDTLVQYQTPGIRASFDYHRPEISKVVTPPSPVGDDDVSHPKYILAIAAALALLLVLIWRMKRK
jgi:hypothetical protein